MSRSYLSCCLVIKNEQAKIASCLENIKILTDEIIIVDTGSTDSSIKIIEHWITKYKAHQSVKIIPVGSRFHDSDGDFDFGGAKNFALQQASKDFVMWLDATDTIVDQKKIKELFLKETNINKNVYFTLPTELTDKFAYIRSRIGPKDTATMVGRVHEYMTFTNINDLKKIFIAIPIQNKKKDRDLNRNLRLLLKEWEKNNTGRNAFYVALTYREMHNSKEALIWYRKRVYTFEFMEEFREEYFKALESIAEIIDESGIQDANVGDLLDVSEQMIKIEPTRVEGYFYMAKYHLRKDNPDEAIKTLKHIATCKKPENYKLWLNGIIHSGKAIANLRESCNTAIRNKEMLKPEAILDYDAFARQYF